MEKFKLPVVIFLALVIGVPAAHAQISPRDLMPNDVRPSIPADAVRLRAEYEARKLEIKAEMDAKRAEVRAEAQLRMSGENATSSKARNASSTERRIEKQHEIAQRHAERTSIRFTAMVERLMNIIERIESRIAKVKAEGGATAEAEASVSAAKADLVAANADIEILKNIEITGDNFQANFSLVKNASAEVKADLRSAHTNLMMAVRALGAAKAGANATSTATSTDSTN